MIGDDINQRENQKLKEYVHEKMEKLLTFEEEKTKFFLWIYDRKDIHLKKNILN